MKQIKSIFRYSRQLIAAAMLLCAAAAMQSCEEDAPTFTHSATELESSWQWNTTEGDAAEYFQVEIRQLSDNEFSIANFHNLDGEEITVSISGTSLSFQGEFYDGAVVISNGKGTITNGWLTMTLEYDCSTDGETEHFKAELNKGTVLSKKASGAINQ